MSDENEQQPGIRQPLQVVPRGNYTQQTAFDAVWRHFVIDKGSPSFKLLAGGDISCLYRGRDGARCAFGVLIPDDQYRPDFEGLNARNIAGTRYNPLALDDGDLYQHFLRSLQGCHDLAAEYGPGVDFTPHVERLLRDLARTYSLEVPVEAA